MSSFYISKPPVNQHLQTSNVQAAPADLCESYHKCNVVSKGTVKRSLLLQPTYPDTGSLPFWLQLPIALTSHTTSIRPQRPCLLMVSIPTVPLGILSFPLLVLEFLNFYFKIFYFFTHLCMYVMAYMQKCEENLWESVISYHYVVLRIKLRSSDIRPIIFLRQGFSMQP